jgi:glycosyltransferase involved in cell wall biosynthesis
MLNDFPNPGAEAVHLSLVIPVYNEAAAIRALVEESKVALLAITPSFEILCVDDGSTDDSATILGELNTQDNRVRILVHAKNSGQAAALWNGIHAARGDIVVTMDGDGQNVPADIPRLIEHLDGCDMVVGIRASRRDSTMRRLISRWSNRIRGSVLRDGVSDSGCALKAFRREVVGALLPIRTLYSFVPALAVNAGFRVREIPVQHRPRTGGRSNYGLFRFGLGPVIDMLCFAWLFRRSIPPADRNCREPATR